MTVLVSSDLLAHPEQRASVGADLFLSVNQASNSVVSALRTGQALPTAAINQVGHLLENGIVVNGIDSSQLAGSLAQIAGATIASIGTIPRIAVSVGMAAISGFAVGGPIGAAIGGLGALGTSLLSAFPSQPNYPPPSQTELINLSRLQNWSSQHSTGLLTPIGWNLYDYVSQNKTHSDIGNKDVLPVCTPWLWGQDPGACDPDGTFRSNNNDWNRVFNEISAISSSGQDANALTVTALNRCFSIDPLYWSLTDLKNENGDTFPPTLVNGSPVFAMARYYSDQLIGSHYMLTPEYGLIYGLGTVFGMVAVGASDQSIASELLLQEHILRTQGTSDDATAADYLATLTAVFLARLPSVAVIAPAPTINPGHYIGPGGYHPGLPPPLASPKVTHPPLSARAKSWVSFYLGEGPPPLP